MLEHSSACNSLTRHSISVSVIRHVIYRNGNLQYCRAVSFAVGDSEWPVEVLAARAGLPVRTIREYQTMQVLPPPAGGGEGWPALITRLQERRGSLAAMRDLFEAWAASGDLAGVLVDPDGLFVDEAPQVLDRVGLRSALSYVPAERRRSWQEPMRSDSIRAASDLVLWTAMLLTDAFWSSSCTSSFKIAIVVRLE